MKASREDFVQVTYKHDENLEGSSPSFGILLAHFSPPTNNANLKRHLTQYATSSCSSPRLTPENGTALGLVHVQFASHTEAKQCIEKGERSTGRSHEHGTDGRMECGVRREAKVVETCTKMLEERSKKLSGGTLTASMQVYHPGQTHGIIRLNRLLYTLHLLSIRKDL